jgi:PAS domain S-box-containing protein/putative nucleotidyltransferase with HDIG domain
MGEKKTFRQILFRQVLEQSRQAQAIVQSAGNVLWGNQALWRLMGKADTKLPEDLSGWIISEDYQIFLDFIRTRSGTCQVRTTNNLKAQFCAKLLEDNSEEDLIHLSIEPVEQLATGQENSMLRALIDNLPDYIFAKDQQGRIILNNLANSLTLGTNKPEETLGKTDLDYYPEEIAKAFIQDDRQILDGHVERIHREEINISRTGVRRWMLTTKVPIYDGKGAITGVVGIGRDITSQKLAEERLQRLNEGFLAFGSTPDENIQRVLALCGEMMSATCAVYSRVEGAKLHTIASWNMPLGYPALRDMEGRLSTAVLNEAVDHPWSIPDLSKTIFGQTDPGIRQYGWKAATAVAIQYRQKPVGALVIYYDKSYQPSQEELQVLRILSTSVGVEEERGRALKQLYFQNEFEKLVANISTHFISLPPEKINAGIQSALRTICEFLGADRGYVFMENEETGNFDNPFCWYSPQVPPQLGLIRQIPARLYPFCRDTLEKQEHIYIQDVTRLPASERVFRTRLLEQGIQTIVIVPLLILNKIVGFVGFDAIREKRDWYDNSIGALLKMASDIFANTFERLSTSDALQRSENRYRSLFEDSPISIWEEDFSQVKAYLNDLRYQGITDLSEYIELHPEVIEECALRIKILDVNQTTLKMFKAVNKNELLENIPLIFRERFDEVFTEELLALWNNQSEFFREGINYTLTGEPLHISLRWNASTGSEERMDRVLVTLMDISARRQAELALERRAREMHALYDTILEINSQRDLVILLPAIVERSVGLVGTSMGALYLVNPDGETLQIVVAHNLPSGYLGKSLRFGEGVSGKVAETGEVVVVEDYQNWDGRAEAFMNSPFKRVMGVPLKLRGQVIGVINAADDNYQGPFSQEEIQLVQMFADQATLAIENTRLLDELQAAREELNARVEARTRELASINKKLQQQIIQRARAEESTQRQLKRMSALHAIDMAITASIDLSFILQMLTEETSTQLNIDAVAVLLLNPENQHLDFAAGTGFNSPGVHNIVLEAGQNYAWEAVNQRRIVHVPDLSKGPYALPSPLEDEGFITYYSVPLLARGMVKGVLEIYQRSHFEPDIEWPNFLQSLAGQTAIAIDNAEMFGELQRTNMDLLLAYESTLDGWSHALELRDQETEGHTRRVTEMTVRLADLMGFDMDALTHIRRGALLHDIGKMGVPDEILLKPGQLTEEEWEKMRMHPVLAYNLLCSIGFLRTAIDIPYCHHEKWDGTGYPRKLKGEEIPLSARIFSIVDVWDALSNDRPYKKAWPEEKVREFLIAQRGIHFDPQVVDLFIAELDRIKQRKLQPSKPFEISSW